MDAIEELIQCGICLEKMSDPRMLPCQHTFCLNCLQNNLTLKTKTSKSFVHCPLCQNAVDLADGITSLSDLPKNLYVNSLLSLITINKTPSASSETANHCSVCKETINSNVSSCLHCKEVMKRFLL